MNNSKLIEAARVLVAPGSLLSPSDQRVIEQAAALLGDNPTDPRDRRVLQTWENLRIIVPKTTPTAPTPQLDVAIDAAKKVCDANEATEQQQLAAVDAARRVAALEGTEQAIEAAREA